MNKISKIIFHIDMNCFYCSCEIAENEDLSGKPIVVAHKDIIDRGIILSPSYEARKYGIKATMKVSEAKRLCKDIIVIEPRMELYHKYSQDFYNYLLSLAKDIKVEMASCDEAYVDVSQFGTGAVELASKIQKDIYELYGLPCSIGIAPNKFLAKMASDMKKPMGITILRKRDLPEVMWPLPIEDLMGIGKKTAP
ncbi:MAG: DNA polymerase IV, partial [Coprobacillus sp.]|nr:DNA polymerase IV [Coprobacillus sp.]